MVDGCDRPESSVRVTLREVYDLICDAREKLVVMSADVRWIQGTMDELDERHKTLQTEIRDLRTEIVDIRSQLADVKAEGSGLRATLETAASIISLVLSLGVAIYVATAVAG